LEDSYVRYSSAVYACTALLLLACALPAAASAATVTAVPVSITPLSQATDIGMPFEKFKEGAESQPGLFTVWKKNGKVWFEIAPSQLGTQYLLVPTLVNGVDAQRFLVSGIPFGSYLISFERAGDKIVVLEDNPYGKAHPNTPAALSVANSYPPSVLSVDPIASIDKATGDLVFTADFLLSDVNDVTTALNAANTSPQVRYNLNSRFSYYGPTKAFPKNVEVETDLTWSSGTGDPGIDSVPDSRNLYMKIHDSILQLPDEGYQPRFADDRVGYFLTARRQYDDQQHGYTNFQIYVNRWRIEKSDPNARVSPAKNPIVFYILNEVPPQYRGALRDAMLEWNKAYEAIGITHAIEVRQQPDDPNWDPDDARYSIVRWATTSIPAFGAAGPSIVNPLTGEIFRGEVIMDANIVRSYNTAYKEIIDPTQTAMSPAAQMSCQLHDCALGLEMAQQRDWGVLALTLDGKFNGTPPDWFMYDSLKAIMLHEFGHTLGLRHNFQGSTVYSMPQVQNKTFSRTHGIVNSVMEYTPLNLSPHGQPQGEFFMDTIGPWDYTMIKYGYMPIAARSYEAEIPTLRALASTYTRPELAYATDEDTSFYDGFATDPRAMTFDLTSDPLRYAENTLSIDQRLFNTLLSRRPALGESYEDVRRDFAIVMRSWQRYTTYTTTFIGAEYFTRNHRGDPHAKAPFIPVPRDQERRAYLLLDRYALADNAFKITPQLINSLGTTRYNHWQADPNDTGRLDFPVELALSNMQVVLLRRMFQPTVLTRLDSMELRTSKPGQTMSLADLFNWTDQSVYGDLQSGVTTVNVVHRNLQHRYAELLAHIMLRPDPGTPTDARALARHHLASVSQRISQALKRGGLEETTQANLEDIRTLADRALSAPVVVPPQ
jgi:hypothetical protein